MSNFLPRSAFFFVLSAALLSSGATAENTVAKSAPDASYLQAFTKWKADLVDDRKQNWLPLAGLFWLKPGENTFGSDTHGAVVFPKGPAHAGVFRVQGNDVTVQFTPGVSARIDGKAVASAKLEPDISGKATVVELGSLRFKVVVRGKRIGIRLKDLESPAIKNYAGPAFFPLDLSYRVTATWKPAQDKKTVDVPNVLGDVTPTPVGGEVVFELNGQEYHLTDLGDDPGKGLFIVFADPTNKTDTYPAGRFLDTDPVADGKVVLDFNHAYNPPCSLTPYATCPLPPSVNRLAIAIPAGEKYDHAHGHH